MNQRLRAAAGLLLVTFWAAATVPAVVTAVRAVADRVTTDQLDQPAGEVVLALEAERRLSATGQPILELGAQRGRTDDAVERLRQAQQSWLRIPTRDGTVAALLNRLDGLADLRATVDSGRLDRRAVVTAYTVVIASGPVLDLTDGLTVLSRSRELLAEEDALLAAVSTGGGPTAADRARLTQLAGARRMLFGAALAGLPPGAARRHLDLSGGPAMTSLNRLEDELATARDGITDPAAWSPVFNEVNTGLWELRDSAAREAADAGLPPAVAATVWAGTTGGIGLVAVVGLLIAARRTRTRTSAPKSTAGVTPTAGTGHRADNLLHDLDRRNQGLLQRQLRLLDSLARRAADDQDAADLRRAGTFGTRLRRNVEKRIILTGGTPDRGWPRLVPITDVLREAAAEISDHDRVTGADVEPAHLAGTAATDLVHLLAELLENAATFAPADSLIVVAGRHDPAGYLVTVTDAGPGMTTDDLATGHEVMADPVAPPGGTWWGLWAAGRLAARQDTVVTLHNGPSGGLLVTVRIPQTLVTGSPPVVGPRHGREVVVE